MQHVVRSGIRFEPRDLAAEDLDQLVVRDDDQRVDLLLQLLDAELRDLLALAFEAERPRHDRNGEDPQPLGDFRNDRRGAGSRSAAHPGGDEQHVGALDDLGDAILVLDRGVAADLGTRPRAETAREVRAELQLRARGALLERLRVGIGDDELDALHAPLDHVLDRIAAAAAYADDFDDCVLRR